MQPPKQVFEVSFLLVHSDEQVEGDDDFHPENESEEFAEDSAETITTMVLCFEELTLAEFTQQCEFNKTNLLEQLGYVDLDPADVTLVSVENVSEVHITVLSPAAPTQH